MNTPFITDRHRRASVNWPKLHRLQRDLARHAAHVDGTREVRDGLRLRLQELTADLSRFELVDQLQRDLAEAGEPRQTWDDPVSALASIRRKVLKATVFAAYLPQLDEALQLRQQLEQANAELAQVSASAAGLRNLVNRCANWAEGRLQ